VTLGYRQRSQKFIVTKLAAKTWVIDTITLPIGPSKVQKTLAASSKEAAYPTVTIILSQGLKGTRVRLEGYIAESGKDMEYLETNYITPLEQRVRKEVALATPYRRLNGWYIFDSFIHSEKGGVINAVEYTMEFVTGTLLLVL